MINNGVHSFTHGVLLSFHYVPGTVLIMQAKDYAFYLRSGYKPQEGKAQAGPSTVVYSS